MALENELLDIIPVLPSQDIDRDVEWYSKYVGFTHTYKDKMYALLSRGQHRIHLQWHADNDDDPLLGGSVIRITVSDIYPIFNEFMERKTVKKEKLREGTPWNTNEFGFYDLNNNAIFIVQDIKSNEL